jgi:hypothetical protein
MIEYASGREARAGEYGRRLVFGGIEYIGVAMKLACPTCRKAWVRGE